MKVGLSILSLAMLSPLVWAMAGGRLFGRGPGHHAGVSDAIWLTLTLMALFVMLCGAILRTDDPSRPN